MNLTFLVLACLIGWIAALPLTHFDSVALERRAVGVEAPPKVNGGKPGSNPGANEHPTTFTNGEGIHLSDSNTSSIGSSPVDIVNKFFEFLHNASDLVNDEGTEKECNNLSLGSAAKQDCQACKDAIDTLSGCAKGKGEIRKNCVCQKIPGIPQAVFSTNVDKCKEVGSLTAACGTAQQGN